MPGELVSRGGRTFRHDSFTHEGRSHDLYAGGAGPTVILIHELGGLDVTTLDIADHLCTAGFRVVLPVLVGRARREGTAGSAALNWIRICISREVHVFLTGRTSPVAVWLRALCQRERGAHPGVGVVGMCFSGGFALAAAVDESVLAAVASQPALPWPLLPGAGRDLGLSPRDVACVRSRFADGTLGVMAARYTLDTKAARERIQRYKTEFGTDVVIEPIGTEHSVLARAAHPTTPDPAAVPALEATLELLRSRLLGSPGSPALPTSV